MADINAALGILSGAPQDAAPAPMQQDDISRKLAILQSPADAESPSPDTPKAAKSGAMRTAVLGARGFNDAVAETLGAIPDLVSKALRPIGLAPQEEGFYTTRLKNIIASLGGPGKQDAQTFGEKLAYGAGHGTGDAMSVLVPATAVANTAKAGSLTANVAKTLASQPLTQMASSAAGGGVGEATDNPLLGLTAAVATPALMSLASRAVTPIQSGMSAERQRLADVAKKEGIDLTAGQKTGSKRLQALESVFEDLPFSGPRQQAITEGNREQFNRAVLNKAGVYGTKATPDVMNDAFDASDRSFRSMAAKTTVSLDNQFLDDLQNVATKYGSKLETQQKPIVQSYLNDLLSSGNTMPGELYQDTRSAISKQAKGTGDTQLASALRGIRNALDSAAERSMPADMKGDWADLRRQYGNLKSISQAVASAGAGAAEGDIPPAQLASAVRQAMGADAYSRGAGDLNDLARVGKTFIQSKVPDSGTAKRAMWMRLLTGGLGLGSGGTALALGHDPVVAAAAAGAGLAAPAVAQRAYMSPVMQAYLKNQLVQGPQMNKGLLGALAIEQMKSQAQRGLLNPVDR